MTQGATVTLRDARVEREDLLSGERRVVLEQIDLTLSAGERAALVGANGAGKTSLLLALVGAVPTAGSIAIDELKVTGRELRRLRERVGFVFADPSDQLFCETVRAEVAFGPRRRGVSDADAAQLVTKVLRAVGLEGTDGRSPLSLSLGEQRRLGLATALACDPALLLLDEPTASLDGRSRRLVLEALAQTEATLLIATHDLDAVLELDLRVVLIGKGRVLADGSASEVLSDAALLDRAGLDPPRQQSKVD